MKSNLFWGYMLELSDHMWYDEHTAPLGWHLEPEYTETALDRELYQAIVKLDMKTKEKLLKTIELWTA